MSTASQSYVSLGNFSGPTDEYVKHLESMRDSLPSTPTPDLAHLTIHIGRAHQKMDNLDLAQKTFEDAVDILGHLPQEEKQVMFLQSSALSGLGAVAYDTGNLDKALERQREALQLRRKVSGREHVSVAEALNNLGATHQQRNLFRKALEYHEEALDILMAHHGGNEEVPDVILTFYNMGLCFRQMKYPEADVALKKAATLAQKVFGPVDDVTKMIEDSL